MSRFEAHNINFLLSLETQGIKLGLTRTKKLLSCCGNPEEKLLNIQIIDMELLKIGKVF